MAKIFIREQSRVGKVQGTPRFALLGVEGSDRKFFQIHVCKSEFDTIAQSIAAEVVMLPRGTGEGAGDGSGGANRKKEKHQARYQRQCLDHVSAAASGTNPSLPFSSL